MPKLKTYKTDAPTVSVRSGNEASDDSNAIVQKDERDATKLQRQRKLNKMVRKGADVGLPIGAPAQVSAMVPSTD